jgi:Protein of unknown function (DUF1579)
VEPLDVFVGEWKMGSSLATDLATEPRARTTFEWMSGRLFLIQRWEVEIPEAPDGLAVIGAGAEPGSYVQHYFDQRGTARIYQMTFTDRKWTLSRRADAPDFSQRFIGTFTDDDTVRGIWEMSRDGSTWQKDFELTYTRLS